MFISKLNNEQLKKLEKEFNLKGKILKDIHNTVYLYNKNGELISLSDVRFLKNNSIEIVQKFIIFMEKIFGKPFISYALNISGIPEELVEKYYEYSDDDWEETK